MKITIKNHTKTDNDITIEYLVEREKKTYNNIVETVILNNSEIVGLSDDEIKTLGFKKIKSIAIRVFTQIEPLDELDNPIDFELVKSIPKAIIIQGSNTLTVGQTYEYNATVLDQYNSPMETNLEWTNKIVVASKKGVVKVTASIGDITNSIDVNVIERVKSKEEIMQETIDKLILDNLNMQMQLDTVIATSL